MTPRRPVVVLVAVLLALCVSSLSAQHLTGRVVAVSDGDTLTVLDLTKQQHRIRLSGIDAPEEGQPFFQTSRTHLSSIVFGQNVTVIASGRDGYGRVIGTVLKGTTNVNLEQVKAGLAWYYREFAGDIAPETRALYDTAETEARTALTGLWRDGNPVQPSAFRSSGTSRAVATVATRPASAAAPRSAGRVIANRNSGIYHVPGCASYNAVAERNRVYYNTEAEALAAGYRKARNCN